MIKSKLKEIADARGLSIRQMAREIDYRFETVRRMYNDDMEHYPSDLLDKLCAYLGAGVADLLTYVPDNES